MALALLALLLPACTISKAAEKQRDWQNDIVHDSSRSRYFAGTIGDANTTHFRAGPTTKFTTTSACPNWAQLTAVFSRIPLNRYLTNAALSL
jgi:hypothetical protein